MFKKVFVLLMFALFMSALCVPVMAQSDGGTESAAVGLTTFTGIVALVSLMVTQGAKLLPAINASTLLKIGVSVAVGVVASFVAQWFGIADFLAGMVWWQVLIQGLLAGLSACGFYDVLKGFLKPAGK